MGTVPLGQGAYKRTYSGAPEIKLLNRWLEANPANPNEGTSILARPGTNPITPLNPGSYVPLGAARGNFSLDGLFNDSLFSVSGQKLYRINQDMTVTHISGTLPSTSKPEVAWQHGVGYERLWISDGGILQYYEGNTTAGATLTKIGAIVNGTDKIALGNPSIGLVYYIWGTIFTGSDNGSVIHPYVVLSTGDPLANLVKAIMASGVAGADYSPGISSPNTQIIATYTDATHIRFTSKAEGTLGNLILNLVVGGSGLSGPSSLSGGADGSLNPCTIPSNLPVSSITQLAGYIVLAIESSQVFYWIDPGATTINTLDFASKESSPDIIVSLKTVGDQMMVIGEKSTENWYATGDSTTPLAPIKGRVYARGTLRDTPVIVDDSVFLVGDDGRVYSIGYQNDDTNTAAWGVTRISNNGIEERIRRQIRRELGLTP